MGWEVGVLSLETASIKLQAQVCQIEIWREKGNENDPLLLQPSLITRSARNCKTAKE